MLGTWDTIECCNTTLSEMLVTNISEAKLNMCGWECYNCGTVNTHSEGVCGVEECSEHIELQITRMDQFKQVSRLFEAACASLIPATDLESMPDYDELINIMLSPHASPNKGLLNTSWDPASVTMDCSCIVDKLEQQRLGEDDNNTDMDRMIEDEQPPEWAPQSVSSSILDKLDSVTPHLSVDGFGNMNVCEEDGDNTEAGNSSSMDPFVTAYKSSIAGFSVDPAVPREGNYLDYRPLQVLPGQVPLLVDIPTSLSIPRIIGGNFLSEWQTTALQPKESLEQAGVWFVLNWKTSSPNSSPPGWYPAQLMAMSCETLSSRLSWLATLAARPGSWTRQEQFVEYDKLVTDRKARNALKRKVKC